MRRRFTYPPIVNHTFTILINGALIILPLFLLISELSEKPGIVRADVIKGSSIQDTVQRFSDAVVLAAHEITITSNSTAIHFFGPRVINDPVYCLLFLLSAIVVVIFFWDFSYKNPFTKKTLWGLRVALALLVIFILINILRYEWFDNQIKMLTNNQYSYDKPSVIASAEVWVSLALIRVVRIFQNGLRLQKEMNLTV